MPGVQGGRPCARSGHGTGDAGPSLAFVARKGLRALPVGACACPGRRLRV